MVGVRSSLLTYKPMEDFSMRTLFKKFTLWAAILAVLFVFAGPANATNDHYQINLYADTGYATAAGGYTPITSGVRYYVFNGGGAKTLATLYTAAGAAKTNPVEATTFEVLDRIDFYIDNSVTSVDIAVMCLNGYSTWLRGATTSTRTVIIDQKPGLHTAFADWSVTKASMNGLTGTATDYWTFESDTVLLPWFGIEVHTATCASDDIQLFGDLSGTAGALFNYINPDAAKTFTWVSQVWLQAAGSRTTGSVFVTTACVVDAGDVDPGGGYLVATGETMTFSGASLPLTGAANDSITTDLENGWGFYHFWFLKLR
jgi:hypothetical protein